MNEEMELVNDLKEYFQGEVVRTAGVQIKKSSHSDGLADTIRDVVVELRKLGCNEDQIRIATLSLCGVPFKPIDTQSALKNF